MSNRRSCVECSGRCGCRCKCHASEPQLEVFATGSHTPPVELFAVISPSAVVVTGGDLDVPLVIPRATLEQLAQTGLALVFSPHELQVWLKRQRGRS